MYFFIFNLLLISFTIPIHTKISIPNIPTKITDFFTRSKEEITHHEFNNVHTLDITNNYGAISIETWKQNCVLIELRKKGSQQFLEQTILESQHTNHHLIANIVMNESAGHGTIKVHVLVPETLPIKITTDKDTISTHAHNGSLDLETNSGNITVIDGNNTIIANTATGNITIQRKHIKSGHALNLQSRSGDITLHIPQEINADMEIHTTSGKINSTLFISLQTYITLLNEEIFKNMQYHVRGWIGHPQNIDNPITILLTTDQGNITIKPYQNCTTSKK